MAALSRGGIAEVLRTKVAVCAILYGPGAGGRSVGGRDARVLGGAEAQVVARTSNRSGGSEALSRFVAGIRGRTGISVVASRARGLERSLAADDKLGDLLANIPLSTWIPVIAG